MKLKAKKYGEIEGTQFKPGDELKLSDAEAALALHPDWFDVIEEKKEEKKPESDKAFKPTETKAGKKGK